MKAPSSVFKSKPRHTHHLKERQEASYSADRESEEAKNAVSKSRLAYWEAAENAQWEASRRV